MEIIQIVFIGIAATVLSEIIKVSRPEFSLQISIITGVIIFLLISSKIYTSINFISEYFMKANIDILYFKILVKIIAISYVAEFGIEICKEANAGAISSKIDLAAKAIIIVLAAPIITALLDLITEIVP